MSTKFNARRHSLFGEAEAVEFDVLVEPIMHARYKINILRAIEEPAQFTSAVEVLQRATEEDEVIVNLQSPGGSTNATDMFVQAMNDCLAHVHVKATGGVHSAGTIILLNADSFELSNNFNALVHNGEIGAAAKFSDFTIQAQFAAQFHERLLRQTYEGFLTPEEITALLSGKDYWFDAEEFLRRANERQKVLLQKLSESQSENVLTD